MSAAALIDFPSRQIADETAPTYDAEHQPDPPPKVRPFVIVPDQVRRLAAARRDPLMAQVYLTLAARANRDGVCWPSQARIAAESGISERKVRSAITAFCETGIITIERQGRTNIYHLTPADAIPDMDYDANCRNVVPVSPVNKDDEYRHQGTDKRHVGTEHRHQTTVKPAPRAAKLDTRTTTKNKKKEMQAEPATPRPSNRIYEVAHWYAKRVSGVVPGKSAREWQHAKALAETGITDAELAAYYDWLRGQDWVNSISLGLMVSRFNEWRSSKAFAAMAPTIGAADALAPYRAKLERLKRREFNGTEVGRYNGYNGDRTYQDDIERLEQIIASGKVSA